MATRLIAHERGDGDLEVDSVRPVASALRLAVAELSRWVGTNGCHALLTRALRRATQEHPALASIQVLTNSGLALAGVEESIESNGPRVVAAALTATLVQLFALLGRVIGDDLTLKLAEQITADDIPGAAQGEDEEEQP